MQTQNVKVWVFALSTVVLVGQGRFRLSDPPAMPPGGTTWTVTPVTRQLNSVVSAGVLGGDMPVPLALRINASYRHQDGANYIYNVADRAYEPNSSTLTQSAMYATFDFGYISAAGNYNGATLSATYVLEDGPVLKAEDFATGTLSLLTQFGLTATPSQIPKLSSSNQVGTYTANATDLGDLAADVQAMNPVGFGAAPTTWQVVVTSDKARVMAFIADFNTWVPVLWRDKFGHKVTFNWTKSTTNLTDGATAVYAVKAMNRFSKGVQVQWASFPSTVTTTKDLLRCDYINVDAPSMAVKGLPGTANVIPTGITIDPANYDTAGYVNPSVAGPLFRPVDVWVGNNENLTIPSWIAAGSPIPTPISGAVSAPTLHWNYEYDLANAAITAITDPLGVRTAFTLELGTTVNPLPKTGGGYHPGDLQIWGVKQASSVDPTTGATRTQSWIWDTSVFSENAQIYTDAFNGTTAREIRTVFAATNTGQPAGNGARSYAVIRKAGNGGAIQRVDVATQILGTFTPEQIITTKTLDPVTSNSLGTTGTLTAPITVVTRTFSPDGLRLMSERVSLNSTSGPLLRDTSYTYSSLPAYLEPARLKTTVVNAYSPDGGTKLAPYAMTTTHVYDNGNTGGPGLLTQSSLGSVGGAATGQTMTYDGDGRLLTVSAYDSNVSTPIRTQTYTYDAGTGSIASVTTAYATQLGGTATSTIIKTYSNFDSVGRPRAVTDERGLFSTMTYDTRGRLLTQGTTGSPSVTMAYPDERTTKSTLSTGASTTEVGDGFGRITTRANPDGTTVQKTYDVQGRPESQKSFTATGSGQPAASWSYDLLDRVTMAATPGGSGGNGVIRSFSYSLNGTYLRTTMTLDTTGLNAISTSDQGALGQTAVSTDALGNVTRYTYNAFGSPSQVTITDPSNNLQTRYFAYDALNRLVFRTEPETGTTSFSAFDGLGNATSIEESTGRVRTLAFDGLGRMVSQSSGDDSLSYSYTGADLTHASTTSNGTTVTQDFEYLGAGQRLSKETTTQPDLTSILNYTYDSVGRVNTLTYPAGRVVRYGYDALNRVTGIWQKPSAAGTEVPVVSGITFNEWGQRQRLTFTSTAYSNWSTKDFGTHLDTWSIGYVTGGLGDPSNPRTFTYDSADRLLQAGEWALTHDKLNRIGSANTSTLGLNGTYNHDGFGNNTSQLLTGTALANPNNFTFNALPGNQLPTTTTPASGSVPTGWNAASNGELSGMLAYLGSNQSYGFAWDGLGRLKTTSTNGYTHNYAYAPSGMRVKLTDSVAPANNRRYAYTAGGLLLSEYAANPTPAWKRDVIYLGGEAIAEVDGSGTHELHNDHLGSPRIITNASGGQIEGRQAYGPYGEKILTDGYIPLTGYTGHIQTDTTGLIYMRGRFYTPSWHRFLNSDQGVDPNSWNQMAYVGGSPFMATDPSGMKESLTCESGFLIYRDTDGRTGATTAAAVGFCDSDGKGGGSYRLNSYAGDYGFSAGANGSYVVNTSVVGVMNSNGQITWGSPSNMLINYGSPQTQSVTKAMWVTAYGPPQFPAGGDTSSGKPVGPGSVASWRIPSPEFPGVGTATGTGTTYYPYGASVTVYDANGNSIYTGTVTDKGPGVPWSASNQQLIQLGVRPESWIDIWQANPSRWSTGWYGVTITWRPK